MGVRRAFGLLLADRRCTSVVAKLANGAVGLSDSACQLENGTLSCCSWLLAVQSMPKPDCERSPFDKGCWKSTFFFTFVFSVP